MMQFTFISRVVLPFFRLLGKPFIYSFLLFAFRYIQKEFQYNSTRINQVLLEAVYNIIPSFYGILIKKLMYCWHQNIFVMRTVEYLYHTFCRSVFMYPP